MLQLSPEPTFHHQLLRLLGTARDLGCDVGEVLRVAGRIIPGDCESWYIELDELARRVHLEADGHAQAGRRISSRNAWFRAASYFRAAGHFLDRNPDDPRIESVSDDAARCFDAAIAYLDGPATRFVLDADGFDIPAIFYPAAGEAVSERRPRPTLLLCNGYDGTQQEMLHINGLAALARGFNVVTFEGPGQPSLVRAGLRLIDAWERVVSPVVDWCQGQAAIDPTRIGLVGHGFGSWLAVRATAREHRIGAVACIDGILDPAAGFVDLMPPAVQQYFARGDAAAVDAAVRVAMAADARLRRIVEQGRSAFGCATPFDLLVRAQTMVLSDLVDEVTCPVLVCDTEGDALFKGQGAELAGALGARATRHVFAEIDSAAAFCHAGASDLMNGVVIGWFEEKLSVVQALDRTRRRA